MISTAIGASIHFSGFASASQITSAKYHEIALYRYRRAHADPQIGSIKGLGASPIASIIKPISMADGWRVGDFAHGLAHAGCYPGSLLDSLSIH